MGDSSDRINVKLDGSNYSLWTPSVIAAPPHAPPTYGSRRPTCTYCHHLGHEELHCWRKKKDVLRPPTPPQPIQYCTSSPLARPVTLASLSTDDRVAALEAQLARLSPSLLGSFSGSDIPAAVSSVDSTTAATPSSCDTSTTWILDSGAARHMSAFATYLTQLSKLKHPAHFFTADGSPLRATQQGTLTIPRDFNVPDVLHVPSLALNLLSIGQLIDAGCVVSFTDSSCFVQDRLSGQMIGKGSRRDGLYTMQHLHLPSSSLPVPVLATVDLARWHQRLGHIASSRLTVLHKQGALGPVSFDSLPPCSICPLAKQSAKPFPISNSRSSAIFDLIHSDVWGPAPLSSKSGFKYYVSFIDDYSRYTWVYLMRQRSDFFSIYQSFTTMVSTQFNRKIKVFRSDSGGEYLSGVFRSLLASDGTLPQLSCSGVPAQNGVAERKHRHILDTTRALLLATSVPTEFWAEALLTAVHLINRLPSFVLNQDTPFYRLHSRSPTYTHVRVFGCTCFVILPPHERTKLTARSIQCAFLGYSTEHKGYRCYDPHARRVRISRNVTFHEHVPFFPTNATPFVSSPIPFMDFPADHSPDPSSPISTSDLVPTAPSPSPPIPFSISDLDISQPSPSSHVPSTAPPAPPALDDSAPLELRRNPSRDRRLPARYVAATSYSTEFGSFLAAVHTIQEPTSYREAIQHAEWRQAMSEELSALQSTGIWELVPLPPDRSLVSCRWIYKVKLRSDGSIERYKARLVARGFLQEYGIDYEETFAPVAKMTSVRTLLAVASIRNWPLFQLDVKNAFLHGDLQEDIFMQPPPGLAHTPGQVCHLRRALYGLKQAPRAWFEKFSDAIRSAGFTQSEADHAMFVHTSSTGCTILLLYVDDMIITGDDRAHIEHTKRHLQQHFSMKDLGPLRYFLGLEIARSSRGILLSQQKYTADILSRAALSDSRTAATPIELNQKFRPDDGEPLSNVTRYQTLVGSLVYLTISRPDIAYAVHIVNQFVAAPRTVHYAAVLRILRYLRGTLTRSLFMPSSSALKLRAYSNADWASNVTDRKSVTGYCIFLGDSLISWRAKKQHIVSRSSTESEYRAMADTTVEIVWLRRLLADMGVSFLDPTPLYCDNKSAIHIGANPVFHERTKHIEIDCHLTRHHLQARTISLPFVGTENQLADCFTKALPSHRFLFLLSKLSLFDPP
ncbi:uncharacterized protein J3R85_017059 [Psidium guajava]|nr:uncharacterized protein J3R85_017059 [Psidium guajava]